MDQLKQEEEVAEPVSPTGQYFNSSVLSVSILGILESQVPLDDLPAMSLLQNVFLPINPRFSSIMVRNPNGVKQWKRVKVNLKDHVNIPIFPRAENSSGLYDDHFNGYLTKIALDPLPKSRPLWEIHIVKYPTENALGHLVFKLHHALGDGFSLMGALFSCLQRADDPSIPLTFPMSRMKLDSEGGESVFGSLNRVSSGFVNSVLDFAWSVLKIGFLEDDRTPIRSGEEGVEFRPINISTITFDLDSIKQIKSNLHVTINDVITGIILLGTRLYMKETNNDDFSKSNSTALVLLNTRNIVGYKSVEEMLKPKADKKWGNQIAFLHVSIPKLSHSESLNPVYFVFKAKELIKRMRNSAVLFLTAKLLEAMRKYRGPEATAHYIHSTLKNSSMAISNMIGPTEQIAVANHPFAGMYFMVVGSPQSLTITVMSYVGKLRVAIGTEKGHIDSNKFKSCIQNAFDMMFKATVTNSSSQANL
ncbi:wax ester synthase/diacylglycerol acyltransferase 11-like [Actinidia eriantha]|uniref:wax ester synthase/diacylglycerol acyltransferase 11-like n=1 Tax=Actinidia eriantha TaxID=165200 RepID=UPI00258E67F9|nr:wax ester synthase/diacylglycerol acyltransferase 11-like [Actinidia eriantha]